MHQGASTRKLFSPQILLQYSIHNRISRKNTSSTQILISNHYALLPVYEIHEYEFEIGRGSPFTTKAQVGQRRTIIFEFKIFHRLFSSSERILSRNDNETVFLKE